ncbi:hypothetical protein UREG_05966 [Uncinocarpus reesii 1704]|uniref:Structural maintenance of chromosomes protein 5 n=1 Tax=Uncinocarpus reesii (strain UAMH 1704) TaxID=336963 RepID=C4JU27_UNCRE|nr:uncharacterized protein UREG_05966 [Uncinocarpus reesii 1704]EEP81124.1 hypothetical protein UREG_05966 [Uncinocarpus reesii 1704]
MAFVLNARDTDTSGSDDEFPSEILGYSQALHGSKRARLTPQLESEDSDSTSSVGTSDDSDQSEPPQRRGADPPNRFVGIRGEVGNGQYRPGAIVRIKLTDFVTYSSAEIRPGPKLNMVIGPNGTGKSTLVCAICLGLGEGPQHLGRARDAAEFIKNGRPEATIEIELASPIGKRNTVVTRIIKRNGNKSLFAINGKQVSGKKVRQFARSLSIQINNLCQFLPQDKVSEFAALTPIELLRSTQRAAAPREVTEWYEDLNRMRAGQKKLQVRNRQYQEALQTLEKRQENQREIVERMRERVAVKKRLEYLELLRPVPKFREFKAQSTEAKNRRRALLQEKEALEAQIQPILEAIAAKRKYFSELVDVVKQNRKQHIKANEFAKGFWKQMDQVSGKMKDLTARIEAEIKSNSGYVTEMKKLTQSIDRIERLMEEGAPEFDISAYNARIREQVLRMRDIQDRKSQLQSREMPIIRDHSHNKASYLQSKQRLDSLGFQAGQQEEKLRRLSEDTYTAWQWLKDEKNQEQFEKRVYGPPLVVCTIKDPKYAMALEGMVQKNDLCAFTVQTRNDFNKLQEILYQQKELHDITIYACSTPLSQLTSPVSDEALQQLGFDGWARDLISGPEPVLATLCSENSFHTTPIMLRDISNAEFEHLENGPISSWIAKTQHYQITRRREYGAAGVSTRVRRLRPARWWTDKPVDDSIKIELQNEVMKRKREMDEVQAQLDEGKAELERLEAEHEEASGEKSKIEREKAEKQAALTSFKALPTRLAQQKDKHKELVERVSQFRKDIESLRKKKDYLSLEKAVSVLQYTKFVEKYRKLHENLVQMRVRAVEARSDWQSLKKHNSDVTAVVERKNCEIDEVSLLVTNLNKEAPKRIEEMRKIRRMAEDDPELSQMIGSISQYSCDQLEAEIDSAKATLDLTYEGNSSRVIEEFERRQQQIDKLNKKYEKIQKDLADFEYGIAEVRGKWEPTLEALIQRISNAFSNFFARIGCAGQVSIDKGEDIPDENGRLGDTSDFDQWSIRIQVKFREQESLAVLNAHRQSGGERAVSTIFYLMALQSLSASPFRVVDEINQGMDPRNERMVHERMVEIACGQADSKDAGGQYFLITPKLLNGLRYQPGMTVLLRLADEEPKRGKEE